MNASQSLTEYRRELTHMYGPVIGGHDLSLVLGFRTQQAFRKALERGHIPVQTFALEGRRGKFAATADIAAWLWNARYSPRRRQQCSPNAAGDA